MYWLTWSLVQLAAIDLIMVGLDHPEAKTLFEFFVVSDLLLTATVYFNPLARMKCYLKGTVNPFKFTITSATGIAGLCVWAGWNLNAVTILITCFLHGQIYFVPPISNRPDKV